MYRLYALYSLYAAAQKMVLSTRSLDTNSLLWNDLTCLKTKIHCQSHRKTIPLKTRALNSCTAIFLHMLPRTPKRPIKTCPVPSLLNTVANKDWIRLAMAIGKKKVDAPIFKQLLSMRQTTLPKQVCTSNPSTNDHHQKASARRKSCLCESLPICPDAHPLYQSPLTGY